MESEQGDSFPDDPPPSSTSPLEDENARLSAEVLFLQNELSKVRIDLGEAESRLTVVECVKEENALALERDKKALSLESVTLKSLLAESEGENARIRAELENKSSTISDVTKSLARKMKSVIPKEASGNILKIQEDTELVKGIIGPLEEQIQALKGKLRHTDALLRETEVRHAKALLAVPSLASWLNGKPLGEVTEALKVTESAPGNDNENFDTLMEIRYGLLLMERNELRQLYEKECETSARFRKDLMEANSAILRLSTGKNEEMPNSSKEPVTSEPKMVSSSEWNRVLGVVKSNDSSVDDIRQQLEEAKKLCEKYKEELFQESIFRKEIEAKWNDSAEKHKSETEVLSINVRNTENLLEKLRTSYSMIYEATRSDLLNLTADREKIVREFKRLQDENDKIVGKLHLKAQEFENQAIELPDKIEDIHTLLLNYRQDLISAKIAKEMLEEKLKGDVSFLKAQITSEQQAKDSMEESLSSEIDDLRGKNQSLENYRKDFESERAHRQEIQERCRGFEDLKLAHAKVLKDNHEFHSRISNLQTELDNSVDVQTDFVRLSQNLQIELEKIRQSDKEVRWQHDEDVSSCPSCKTSFGPTKRKHHCKHCGKVFCNDCLPKIVNSGSSGRASRVCNVCHTLLVSDSVPYFSTEVPMPM